MPMGNISKIGGCQNLPHPRRSYLNSERGSGGRIHAKSLPLLLFILTTFFLAACANNNPGQSGRTATPFTVVVTLTPSPTPNRSLGGAADHSIGPDDAFLSIVMYGDFQCALCLDVARSLAIIRTNYPADVRVVWRHFVQPADDKARLAAQASEAAAAQGRFWEMHDQLFIHQAEWIALPQDQFRARLTDYAKFIGLSDLAAFNNALDQETYGALVDKATQEAQDLGLKGIPALLFNGQPYSGRIDEYALDGQARLRLLEKRWYPHIPDMAIDVNKKYTATLVTEKGNIVIELFAQAAPITVNNFVYLVQDGWYNNITFHLVVPNQIAQTGDPSGTGFGWTGYHIPDERTNGLIFDREGLVAMASQRGVQDSGSSQFFITYGPLRPAQDYDGQFTIFGQVIQGMDVLRKLTPRNPFGDTNFINPPPGDKLITIQITVQ